MDDNKKEPIQPVSGKIVPRYAGPSTFARIPELRDVEECDIAIVGVPFDAGTSYRPGARFGPQAVRQASRQLRTNYHPNYDVEPFKVQQVADAGDIACNPFNIDEAIKQIEDGATEILNKVGMRAAGAGKTRIIFHAPSRGLIGYQNKFLTETRGTGVMNRIFSSYDLYKGEVAGRKNGALISTDTGTAVAYAIFNLQDRGTMFISHQTPVYQGMIVGEHTRDNDLEINVLKGKQLTNVRASGTDEAVKLVTPRVMSLEQMMAYINEDELLEVTPSSLRLRKKFLDPIERKRQKKSS